MSYIEKKFNFYWKYFFQPLRKIKGLLEDIMSFNNFFKRIHNNIQYKAKKYRYQLVISMNEKVERLLGFTDQYEEDCYWVLCDLHGNIHLESCVGGFTILKNKINLFDYLYKNNIFYLNNGSIKQGLINAKKKGIIIK